MEFTLLLLLLTIVMLVAWHGRRTLAVGLFLIATIVAAAVFRHHATDVLNLSF